MFLDEGMFQAERIYLVDLHLPPLVADHLGQLEGVCRLALFWADDPRWPLTSLDALYPRVEMVFRHGFLRRLIHDFHREVALVRVQNASHPLREAVYLACRRDRFVLV